MAFAEKNKGDGSPPYGNFGLNLTALGDQLRKMKSVT
jgi:hypothetical protein